jgi:hypothetical protein
MLKPCIILLLITPLLGCVGWPETQDEWAFHVLNAVDAAQTVQIGESECYHEGNPITRAALGTKPEEKETLAFFFLVSYMHRGVTVWLEDKPPKYRRLWAKLSIGAKAVTVVGNQAKGIGPLDTRC